MRKLDLTNQKFGRLTALYENGKTQDGRILWHCVCECGNETNVQVSSQNFPQEARGLSPGRNAGFRNFFNLGPNAAKPCT